jgi:hypothetical protein
MVSALFYSISEIVDRALSRLGVHAFHAALSKKPTQYRKIVKALAVELDRPSAKRLRKKHQALIKETHTLLAQLSF